MLSEEVTEKLIERIVNRLEKVNTNVLSKIAKDISKLGTLSVSDAQKLGQILKYGGSYEKITQELAKVLNVNVNEIYEIFDEVAKRDLNFAKQFYDYRGIDFIPYDENIALKNQVKAMARMTAESYINLANTTAIGFSVKDLDGKVRFKGLRQAYYNAIDDAVLSVSQGKDTFNSQVRKIVNSLGNSGIKTLDYESGRSVRLDSAVRMNLQSALRDLHNTVQEQIGQEYGADGVEISVHAAPAIDHQDVQGRQFSNEEYHNFQLGITAKDYQGRIYDPMILNERLKPMDRRPISELNCYHYVFSIVLGVNKPEYSNKDLQNIINKNNKGFDFDGKHYSMYDGTQLQRRIETAIRKEKDKQIMARQSDQEELAMKSQFKINQLTDKYNELNQISGLKPKLNRLSVSGYRKIKENIEIEYARKNNTIWHTTENLEDILKSDKFNSISVAVNKSYNDKVKYGTQRIIFEPEVLENVNKETILYKGDGGNQYSGNKNRFNNVMQLLKNKSKYYNEIKFNQEFEATKYIKKVYIRDDEPQKVIDLLKEKGIEYEFYKDKRIRK